MVEFEKQRSWDRALFVIAVVVMLVAALAWLRPVAIANGIGSRPAAALTADGSG